MCVCRCMCVCRYERSLRKFVCVSVVLCRVEEIERQGAGVGRVMEAVALICRSRDVELGLVRVVVEQCSVGWLGWGWSSGAGSVIGLLSLALAE